jgi:hypothetical protein
MCHGEEEDDVADDMLGPGGRSMVSGAAGTRGA